MVGVKVQERNAISFVPDSRDQCPSVFLPNAATQCGVASYQRSCNFHSLLNEVLNAVASRG